MAGACPLWPPERTHAVALHRPRGFLSSHRLFSSSLTSTCLVLLQELFLLWLSLWEGLCVVPNLRNSNQGFVWLVVCCSSRARRFPRQQQQAAGPAQVVEKGKAAPEGGCGMAA